MHAFDGVIIGAGVAGQANFSNRDIALRQPHKHSVSQNPNFCRSALSRCRAADVVALVQRHGFEFHKKHNRHAPGNERRSLIDGVVVSTSPAQD